MANNTMKIPNVYNYIYKHVPKLWLFQPDILACKSSDSQPS